MMAPCNRSFIGHLLLFFLAQGMWAHSQTTTSVLVYPANGSTGVDTTKPFQWTSVSGAQVYYLYVGSTIGARDLHDSGEISTASRLVDGLPAGRKVYARIWTKLQGLWYYRDSAFTTSGTFEPHAIFISPSDGATNIDPSKPFAWTAVSGAQAYYLYVGTSRGSKDLADTGEIQQTSRLVPGLPPERQLYARIWSKVLGAWYYTDAAFTSAGEVSSPYARLTYPMNGATDVDTGKPFQWTAVSGVQAYYLYVGSVSGGKDLHESGEILTTSRLVSGLPSGRKLYARIWTKVGGVWYYTESAFTTSAGASTPYSTLIYPSKGATDVYTSEPFEWTPVSGVQAYYLYVGSYPGAKDLHDSGEILATNRLVSGLPTAKKLYARIWTKVQGFWYYTQAEFTTASTTSPPYATLTYPAQGAASVDLSKPFQWTAVTGAQAYSLHVGTSPGGKDLHDSGEILTTSRFVNSLPPNRTVYARIWTKAQGEWKWSEHAFSASESSTSPANQLQTALSLTNQVRAMAGADNRPYPGTPLYEVTTNNGRSYAFCTDYAMTLLKLIADSNAGTARFLNIGFNSNNYDMHTLIEYNNAGHQSWMLLDPTFALTVKRSSDGLWATAVDVSNATRAANWGALNYVFLGSQGDRYARSYYLDYPLLYLNLYSPYNPYVYGSGSSVLPYLQEVSPPISGSVTLYALRNEQGGSAKVIIDGSYISVPCDGIDTVSVIFFASSISLPADSPAGIRAYKPRRYVF